MSRKKDNNHEDPLTSLVKAAGKNALAELIFKLAKSDMSIRRKCLNLLKDKVAIKDSVKEDAASSEALSLWYEIEPEPANLDEYGGGDYSVEDDVGNALNDFNLAFDCIYYTVDLNN